jgi:hypothetical protein
MPSEKIETGRVARMKQLVMATRLVWQHGRDPSPHRYRQW